MFLSLPYPHTDQLDRGTDPRIRIRTKMSWIRYTAFTKATSVHGSATTFVEKNVTQVESQKKWDSLYPTW
jgi:hypothetical protein